MRAPSKIDMIAATRLTREGRLTEAMALLRGALPDFLAGAPRPAEPAGGAARPGPEAPPTAEVLDMVPPSGGEQAWTPPRSGSVPAAVRAVTRVVGRHSPKLPEALRGFLDRIGNPGGLAGLGGAPTRPAPDAAVPRQAVGGRFIDHDYADAAGSRRYKLYIPGGYAGQPVPLVIMLHGCTQSPDDFAAGTGMNALAEEQTFLVAYPAQPASANASKCWNWFNSGDQQRDRGEPALIAGITRRILQDFAIEPGAVYVAGLSAGGAAAAIMGATYPELYAAIGVHSGLACGAASDMASAFAAMQKGGRTVGSPQQGRDGQTLLVPTIVFHGDRDSTVNPVNGDQVIAQAAAARGQAAWRTIVNQGTAPGGIGYTRRVEVDGDGRPMLEQWVLHGVGHAWSGGASAGSYTEPRGPDASREMLRFFQQHRTRHPAPAGGA